MAEHQSDEQLLARFIRGDRAALGELASRYESLLIGGIVWWVLLIAIVLGLRAVWRSHARAAATEPAPIA